MSALAACSKLLRNGVPRVSRFGPGLNRVPHLLAPPQRRLLHAAPRSAAALRLHSPALIGAVLARHFSADAAVAAKSSRDVSHLDATIRDPYVVEAEQQLAAGNPADAIGLHPDAGAIGNSGLWQKYSPFATFSLLAVAAVSKEWYILDEEIILLSTFAFTAFNAYLYGRVPVYEALKEEQDEINNKWLAGFDAKLDAYDNLNKDLQEVATLPDALASVPAEDAALLRELHAAEERIVADQFVSETEKALQQYEAQENKRFTRMRDEQAQRAVQHVMDAFTKGPQAAALRKEALGGALQALKSGQTVATAIQAMVQEQLQKAQQEAAAEVAKTDSELRSHLKEWLEMTTAQDKARYDEVVKQFADPSVGDKLLAEIKALPTSFTDMSMFSKLEAELKALQEQSKQTAKAGH